MRPRPLYPLALAAGLLPLATFNLCYLIGVDQGHLPACVPYLEGCTTTSSTGRAAPEALLFRAGMIPGAVAMALFWLLAADFDPRTRKSLRLALAASGAAAAVFLIVYTVALGLPGEGYRLQRRIGINGFFLLSFVAQVGFALALRRGPTARRAAALLLALCAAELSAGVAGWALADVVAEKRRLQNIVEWNVIVLLAGYFVAAALLWRREGYCASFSARAGRR